LLRILGIPLLLAGAFALPFFIASLTRDRQAPAPAPAAAIALTDPAPVVPLLAIPDEAPEPDATVSVKLGEAGDIIGVEESGIKSTWDPVPVIQQVRNALSTLFYVPVSEEVLDRPSVFQIVDALGDEYTEYLTASEFAELKEEISVAKYDGVGLLVGPDDRGLLVTSALRGPAREAGIRPGDVILSINGERIRDLHFERAIRLFKGENGSVVDMTVSRPGEERKWHVRVVRSHIDSPPVRSRMMKTKEGPMGYVRILSFSRGTGRYVRDATIELLEGGARGLVLDLRGNPGGLLDEAVDVVSTFLAAGVVLTTDSVHREAHVMEVTGNVVAPKLKLITLVDRQSASAAEIVAAALGEQGRAPVIGKRTFGKASVQSVVPLSNGGALRLTTSTYLTPSGSRVAGEGIKPQVSARDNPLTQRDEGLGAAKRALVASVRLADQPPVYAF
jgi:carboxyl-terminal processing protease